MKNVTCRQLVESDYDFLLEHDKAVYPSDCPCIGDVFERWFSDGDNRDFGLVFEIIDAANNHAQKYCGMCIFIPLNHDGSAALTSGRLAESELTRKEIFDNDRDGELFLHCYHVEKFRSTASFNGKSFFLDFVVPELQRILKKRRNEEKTVRLSGLSALAVTHQGIRLFEEVLKFQESDFISDEHILLRLENETVDNPCNSGKGLEIWTNEQLRKKFLPIHPKKTMFKDEEWRDIVEKNQRQWKYQNRCKMLVLHNNQESPVWNSLGEFRDLR